MKLRQSAVAVLMVCFMVVFLMTAAAYGSPLQTSATKTSAVQSPAIALGQPGLSYRYVQTFGITETPYFSDTTHLNRPQGLFVDGSNNLYVVEEQGHRLLRYNSSGVNTLVIGTAGMNYTDDYVFSSPAGVALDASGNIWVADNSRVVQYTPTGVISQSLPARDDSPWNSGNTNGRFDGARGFAFDSVGRMYVSDSNNHRVQVYDMGTGGPVYHTTIGVTSVATSTNAGFNNPQHIAIAGNLLYVADAGNERVQILNISNPASPIYVATLGVTGQPGSDNDHLAYPTGVAVDANYIYVSEGDNNRVQIFNRTTHVYVATLNTGGYGQGNDQFWNPFDVAVDSAGNIYVADRFNYRVQQFNSSRNYVHTYGTTSVPYLTDNYHYNHPRVAIDSSNNIIVLEENGQRLIKLDSNGVSQWSVGVPGVEGNDNTHFWWPHGVAVDKIGNIYVADNTRIQIFKSNGTYSATLGTGSGTGDYQFNWATGIAVDNNGNIYVVDYPNHRVQIYNSNLVFVGRIGATGECSTASDRLCNPIAVAVDSTGQIYVTDAGNSRVQKFNNNRQWQMTIGSGTWGDLFDQFNWPEDIAVDAQGKIYVTDWSNQRVQVFDSTGAYLTTIGGTWGNLTSQFRGTSGVDVDGQGNVYVADFDNARIQKFAPGVPGWRQKNINGFGNRGTSVASRLRVFNGQLYASTLNDTLGGGVWRSSDATAWTQSSLDGFGVVSNTHLILGQVFNGTLYAGTSNSSMGGELWRCTTCTGVDWTQVMSGGFGDINNQVIEGTTVFSNTIYVFTDNFDAGAEVWKSSTGGSGTWTQFNMDGFGDSNNAYAYARAVFSGTLYVATAQWGKTSPTGVEVWRTDGVTWTQVNVDGFGDANNLGGWLEPFNGYLYIGLNTGQIWRCAMCDGSDWNEVVNDGFGDVNNSVQSFLLATNGYLYAATDNSVTGTELWRTADGMHWQQINIDGFGNSNNVDIWSGVWFNNQLYFGTLNNASGGQIWQLLKQVYLPVVIRN
jgi:uncharacterized protein YjiK